jgi:hypothetical protein
MTGAPWQQIARIAAGQYHRLVAEVAHEKIITFDSGTELSSFHLNDLASITRPGHDLVGQHFSLAFPDVNRRSVEVAGGQDQKDIDITLLCAFSARR